jgi:hemerythrin-like metal-binding protein
LFEICNELNDAHQKGIAGGVVEEKLKELYQYSYYHFDSEEKDLEENGYEELENQKKEHNFFKKRLSELQINAKSGNLVLTIKLLDFLREWIISHILGSDMEYSELLSKKKVLN